MTSFYEWPLNLFSLFFQTGVVGENVHINCAAVSIPEAKEVYWRYHGETIDDGKLTCLGTNFFLLKMKQHLLVTIC